MAAQPELIEHPVKFTKTVVYSSTQTVNDDQIVYFGTDQDGGIRYDETTDDAIEVFTANVTLTAASKAASIITGTSTPATAITGGATGTLTLKTGASVANHAGATGGATGAWAAGSGAASSTLGTSGASGAVSLTSGTSEDAATGSMTLASGNSTGTASSSGAAGMLTGTVVGTANSGAITVRTGTSTIASAATGGDSGQVSVTTGATDCTDAGGTGGDSGPLVLGTGDCLSTAGTSGNTGAVTITTGGSADANSGAITLQTGTAASGTRGNIVLNAPYVSVSGDFINPRLVQAVLTVTGGSGGATAGTLDLDIQTLNGSNVAVAKQVIIKASLSAANPQALVSTVTFASASLGSIVATGNGYAVVLTDATGNFACVPSDSADETVHFFVESAPGVAVAGQGCVVVESVADTATWAA